MQEVSVGELQLGEFVQVPGSINVYRVQGIKEMSMLWLCCRHTLDAQEELNRLDPNARVIRLDPDEAAVHFDHEQYDDFEVDEEETPEARAERKQARKEAARKRFSRPSNPSDVQ